MGGVPPAMGLGVVLAGFPALVLLAYSAAALLLATLLSSLDTDGFGRDGFDGRGFDDTTFASSGASDASGEFGVLGMVLLVIGLAWLVSAVYAAAGSRVGRAGLTFFVGGVLVLTLISTLIGAADEPSALIAGAIASLPPLYVLWAFWGRPARGMF